LHFSIKNQIWGYNSASGKGDRNLFEKGAAKKYLPTKKKRKQR
jgi:hypothetical protein